MREPVTAYVGLGGNVGDRADMLRRAVRALESTAGVKVIRCSAVYETVAIGPPQASYLNAAVEVATTLAPRELLAACGAIEASIGRRRIEGSRQAPRPIDLDILLYGDEILADADLVVPHPRLHTRAFALVPLLELVGNRIHPALGRGLRDLLADVGEDGVRRTMELL